MQIKGANVVFALEEQEDDDYDLVGVLRASDEKLKVSDFLL